MGIRTILRKKITDQCFCRWNTTFRFLFVGYQTQVRVVVDQPTLLFDSYVRLAQRLQFPWQPSEALVHWIGHYYLGANKTDNALVLFRFNAQHYPQSSHVYHRLGEAYPWAANENPLPKGTKKQFS